LATPQRPRQPAQQPPRSGALDDFPGIDGIVPIIHGTGCGMASKGEGYDVLSRTLWGYATHPNFAAVVMVGLGCEMFQIARFKSDYGIDESDGFRSTGAYWDIEIESGIGGITIEVIQLGVQARNRDAIVRGLGHDQFGLDPAQLHIAIEHIVHRLALDGVDLLTHMGNAPVGGDQAVARVRTQVTAQQGEQAGFAGAIGADQAGFLAGMQAKLGVF